MKNLYESILNETRLDADRAQLKEAILDFFHVKESTLYPDKAVVSITKSGSYYDVQMDLSHAEIRVRDIIIDIEKSKSADIDFKHTRVRFKTSRIMTRREKLMPAGTLIRSNGAEINTSNFFTNFWTDGDIWIQGCSIGKDIEIKTTNDQVLFDTQGRNGLYINGKITCKQFDIKTKSNEVVDMTHMGKSSIKFFTIYRDVTNSQGLSSVDQIIMDNPDKVRDLKFVKQLYQMPRPKNDDPTWPQINPKIFDILKLPDISFIRTKRYIISFVLSDAMHFSIDLCKKSRANESYYLYAYKTEQEDPKMNAEWDVYF